VCPPVARQTLLMAGPHLPIPRLAMAALHLALLLAQAVTARLVPEREAAKASLYAAPASPCDIAPHRRHRLDAERRHASSSKFIPPDEEFFIVVAPHFSEHCGGCQVLHRLCDQLNVIFTDVRDTPLCYMVPMGDPRGHQLNLNPRYKTPMLPAWLNASAGIAIYPEVVTGNPLAADRVISWILYFPGVNGGTSVSGYDTRNIIACYSPGFCADFDGGIFTKVALRIVDYEFTYFVNADPPPTGRSGALTFRHKEYFSTPRLGRIHTDGNFSVPENPIADGGKRSRVEQYARADTFHSMDPATFRSVEATMAGAISVVVPVPGVDKAEWMASVGDEFRYGVAYGADDVDRARATLPCVMPHLHHLAAQERRRLTSFVQQVLAHFEGRRTV
jgi:hypothetical protein